MKILSEFLVLLLLRYHRIKDICDIMYTNMVNYIICLLKDGIYKYSKAETSSEALPWFWTVCEIYDL